MLRRPISERATHGYPAQTCGQSLRPAPRRPDRALAELIAKDIVDVSDETEAVPRLLDLDEARCLERIYGKLLDFARDFPSTPTSPTARTRTSIRLDDGLHIPLRHLEQIQSRN